MRSADSTTGDTLCVCAKAAEDDADMLSVHDWEVGYTSRNLLFLFFAHCNAYVADLSVLRHLPSLRVCVVLCFPRCACLTQHPASLPQLCSGQPVLPLPNPFHQRKRAILRVFSTTVRMAHAPRSMQEQNVC
eukprot:4767-Rhodomonas_salina.4